MGSDCRFVNTHSGTEKVSENRKTRDVVLHLLDLPASEVKQKDAEKMSLRPGWNRDIFAFVEISDL